jgi:hypothetical protein
MADSAVDALKKAADGMLYPSETDAPFEVVHWGKDAGGLDDARVRELAGHEARAPVERCELDEFLAPLAEAGGADAARCAQLKDALAKTLHDVRVYRVGKVEIDAYVVGKTKDGDLAGLKTKVVET